MVSPDGATSFCGYRYEREDWALLASPGLARRQPLAGTEGGGWPFWSPDSRQIGSCRWEVENNRHRRRTAVTLADAQSRAAEAGTERCDHLCARAAGRRCESPLLEAHLRR